MVGRVLCDDKHGSALFIIELDQNTGYRRNHKQADGLCTGWVLSVVDRELEYNW